MTEMVLLTSSACDLYILFLSLTIGFKFSNYPTTCCTNDDPMAPNHNLITIHISCLFLTDLTHEQLVLVSHTTISCLYLIYSVAHIQVYTCVSSTCVVCLSD